MSSETIRLRIYSAGAVAPPLQEATRLFEEKHGIRCRVTPGKPEALLLAIANIKEGDVFSAGAEYVLDDAEDRGLTIPGTRQSLGYRRSVIIVPPSNPACIHSLSDLCREGVRIGIATEGCLKGVWDDIASKAGLTESIRKNITRHADACGSLMSLIHTGEVDAIFGWNAFQNVWPDTCEAVELPPNLQVYRSTTTGILTCTKDLELSKRFISFLITSEAKKIYSDYGWIYKT
ncbi:substrate-binding domain-containing protein [Candidatus Bathyarchaeota archaeon]|nr:substrate-binding domain-containing protein [Candidatus Bathyarchaeota archaeon]